MIKLLTIIGARPQIIKAAAISRAINTHFSNIIEEKILHTGQHYDKNMSQVFFEELGIPKPNYNLAVGSASHGEQTAKMILGIENVLKNEQFDGIILYGDTNSTLAGAISASKMQIPIFHIEAGLRSFNMSMPEEINRIICDQVSSILFAPTETAIKNIYNEGLANTETRFPNNRKRLIYNSGDVMFDNSKHFAQIAKEKTSIIKDYGLKKNEFILATIHRNNNTDNPERLINIFTALLHISKENKIKIIIPLHPRTAKILEEKLDSKTLLNLKSSKFIQLIPPTSFLEIIELERNSRIIMTDSGGVQKEAFFFEKPCIIFRSETEWTEIIEYGAGITTDASTNRIIDAYNHLINKEVKFPHLFGDGKASIFILEKIHAFFLNQNL